jgi:hypothetical protein
VITYVNYVVASSVPTREKASFSLFSTYVVENKPAFSPLKEDVRIGPFSRTMRSRCGQVHHFGGLSKNPMCIKLKGKSSSCGIIDV